MQKRESSAWHVCDSFLLNFHNCNSMVPYQWSMIEEWKKIKSRSRDFQFLFLGAKRPFKSIGLMIVSIKRLMIRSNRHGAPVLPRQRIEGDYHHCNLHLSCLQEPAAHLCSSKMDGNWTFHCWTVFKWLTDVKLLNTYKETVAWSRIVERWSYLPKDWWVEAEELFHLWSQDTEQSFTFALPATVSSEVNLLLCNTIQLYAIWSDLFWGNIKRFMSEVKELVHLWSHGKAHSHILSFQINKFRYRTRL